VFARSWLPETQADDPASSLVCSDLIARGIDLPSVSHVISYDAPVDIRKYVHRVGRTARAGREGVAWSLVEKQEVSLTHSEDSYSGRMP
jgi:ATP-dependent RNA helicase DDX51/DBP6